jgi:alpha/beta superfamily hydrolase
MPEVIFNGPAGRIEGRYHHSSAPNPPVALVIHPHPAHGGTMNNKVTYNTYQCFVNNGFSVLRFNFRGVGKSEGKFDNGVGELSDAATALDWLQMINPLSTVYWIAGFSFGSWIAMQLFMRRPEIQGFIAVSPPVNKYDFSFLNPCPAPGIVIQGDQDSIVDEDAVATFVEKVNKLKGARIDYEMIEGGDHFFRGKIDDLNEIINHYLATSNTGYKPLKPRPDRRRRQVHG